MADVEMVTRNENGQTRERRFSLARIQQEPDAFSDQRFFLYFHEPKDVKRMSHLVWRHPSGPDERWLFLPAVKSVRRIAAKDARSSFFGSCFFYEDITGRSVDKDEFTIREETDSTVVLQAIPRTTDDLDFDAYRMTIARNTGLPIDITYVKSGRVTRRLAITEVRNIEGRTTPTRFSLTDLHDRRVTTLTYLSLTYDVPLEWDLFTERILRNPPRELTSR